MKDSFLYRGVSASAHESSDGILCPKAAGPFVYALKWGERGAKWGEGTWGPSPVNAVLRHQLNQEGFPTSGISATPFFARAEFYALHGGKHASGVVYKLSQLRLAEFGVEVYRVSETVKEPAVPEDEEVILVTPGSMSLPPEAVVDAIRVGAG